MFKLKFFFVTLLVAIVQAAIVQAAAIGPFPHSLSLNDDSS